MYYKLKIKFKNLYQDTEIEESLYFKYIEGKVYEEQLYYILNNFIGYIQNKELKSNIKKILHHIKEYGYINFMEENITMNFETGDMRLIINSDNMERFDHIMYFVCTKIEIINF